MDHKVCVVFGNPAAVQFGHDNILLGEEQQSLKNEEFSGIFPVPTKIPNHNVLVINMIGLHETELYLDSNNLFGQMLDKNIISAFIFVVPQGQLTDADKIEWLQRIFGDRVLQFVIILFTYEKKDGCDSKIDDLKKNSTLKQLLDKCGRRFNTCSRIMSNQLEIEELMARLEDLFIENKHQCYTKEMYNTHLREKDDQQKKNELRDESSVSEPLHTTTTETKEIYKRTTHKFVIGEEGPIQGKENEELMELFRRLHLEKNNTLKAADVLQLTAHSLQCHTSSSEEKLVQTFLQRLLLMDYRARFFPVRNQTRTQDHAEQDSATENDAFDIFIDSCKHVDITSTSHPVHPMDVQMAVFHCADSFLKQLMVTKLSQCQFALPLLVPDPFTQQIQFPLWTFRQTNKSWNVTNHNGITSKIQPVCKAKTPMVSFFKFGSLSLSKSQLMNSLINEKHNTFFHRNCPGSSKTRLLMDGVVEIAWYCPSGKNTDKFTECVAFCNLHGDAGDNVTQKKILTEMASVNVVVLPKLDKNDKNATDIQNLSKEKTPLICLLTEEEFPVIEMRKGKYKIGLKERNLSDVSEELRQAINDCLSSDSVLFILEDVAKHSDITVDEKHDEDCRRGKEAADQMMSLLKNIHLAESKKRFLPCQGKLWHQWCEKNKQLHRPQGDETEIDTIRKKTDMRNIREEQHQSDVSKFMMPLMKQIDSQAASVNIYFFKWLQILLDEFTAADLSDLHCKYDKTWSVVLKLKENDKHYQHRTDQAEQLKAEQRDLETISNDLQAAAFGLEHILREFGQIYESCFSLKKNKEGMQIDFSSLPSFAAEMMISGYPLELMDGDASHVPLDWVTAVLDELIDILGDKTVFVLSVLGIQSSGKSTLLNAMFGLQFAVSAGRCTKGAFMQLVKVSEEMKDQVKFDYILVVDTEGLRDLELDGKSARHHDNELATFIVGLGNLTLINIFGENLHEMQNILQIVVQAFLRMKKVRLNPSCMFVHQNVSDIAAREKNIKGRRQLQDTLDEMTRLAAREEVYDVECFSDVITFDIQNDVKYFAQFWESSPPMAPLNPSYCENVRELKENIFTLASESDGITLTNIKERIKDLWEALLNERFVFSFQNSQEITAYRKLETEYIKWTWTLRSAMQEIENKLYIKIENDIIDEIEVTDLQSKLKEKSEQVSNLMSEFFEKDTDACILIQWKSSIEIKIEELQENIIKETNNKLNQVLRQRDLKRKMDAQRTCHENTLIEKSKELALKLKNKGNNEQTLKTAFDSFWKQWVDEIIRNTYPIKDIDVLGDVKKLLSDNYKSTPGEYKRGNDILKVKYSEYVKLKRPSGMFNKAIKVIKNRFCNILSAEDEIQIKTLISDVHEQTEKMIMAFNISKLGYNYSYIQQLTEYIKSRVTEHQEGPVKYVFKNEFFIDLVFTVFEKAVKSFTDQYKLFRERNDPALYVKRKREEYYSIFHIYCQGATSAAIFGEIICQKLKERIQQSVYKCTAKYIVDQIRFKCESLNGNKLNLEKHILKTLAEEENFSAYMYYIQDPRNFFKSFIKDEVSQYITDHFNASVLPEMKENIKLLHQKIKEAALSSTEHVKVNSGNANLWLKYFTEQITDVLIFSVKDFAGVKRDDVDDFNLLQDVVVKELPSIVSDICNKFSTANFLAKIDHEDRPDQILIDQICHCCWVQCPFCKVLCSNTLENHKEDHKVPFHRVNAINGFYDEETVNFCTEFCSSLVTSNKRFESSDKWIPFKDYRNAGGIYAEWSITPDVSELPYWKWFVCRFQNDLEKYYGKPFKDHSKVTMYWSEYTKQEAIDSLEKYHTLNPLNYSKLNLFVEQVRRRFTFMIEN